MGSALTVPDHSQFRRYDVIVEGEKESSHDGDCGRLVQNAAAMHDSIWFSVQTLAGLSHSAAGKTVDELWTTDNSDIIFQNETITQATRQSERYWHTYTRKESLLNNDAAQERRHRIYSSSSSSSSSASSSHWKENV